MKEGIHPEYHPVVFVDVSADFELVTRSTKTSSETRDIDGVEHYVLRVEISSASHPFFTGQQRFVDTAGRVEKFQRKYEKFYKTDDSEPAEAAAEAEAKAAKPAKAAKSAKPAKAAKAAKSAKPAKAAKSAKAAKAAKSAESAESDKS